MGNKWIFSYLFFGEILIQQNAFYVIYSNMVTVGRRVGVWGWRLGCVRGCGGDYWCDMSLMELVLSTYLRRLFSERIFSKNF